MIDFDDSAPTSSAATGGSSDLAGLFSYAAQPAQVHAQAPPLYQPQQQQIPSTHAPTPLFYNNNSNIGGMNAFMQSTTPNSMTPHKQLSGTPPASIVLPQSKPGSQRSTPVPAPAPAPNYFGNAGARGPIGGGNIGMGGSSGSMPMGAGGTLSVMNLSSAMSGMSLNGGNMGMGMGPGPATFHSQSHPQPTPAPTSTTAPSGQKGTDPFADLAGLF